MRRLVWFCGVLAVLWSGYWALGTWALRKGAVQAFDGAAAQGMVASYDGLEMVGFPTAFDLTLHMLDIGNPVTGQRWQTPSMQITAAAWQPWNIKISASDDHVVTLPDQQLALISDAITASITSAPVADLPLTQLTAAMLGPDLRSTLGWQVGADVATFAMARGDGATASYDLAFDATNLRPDPRFVAASGLDAVISQLGVAGTVTLTAPLDRHAGDTRPALTGLTVTRGDTVWGDISLQITGSIAADAAGLAEGRFDITVKGWRNLLPALVATGTITADVAPTVEGLLNAMAAQSGDPETLLLPLVFSDGRGTLGPLPLGPAPRLIAQPLN